MPIAIVKSTPGDKASYADVQRCVLDRLGRSYALERVIGLQDLGTKEWPKTTSGKVLKRELQKMMVDLIKREESEQANTTNGVLHSHRRGARMGETELQNYILLRVQASGILVSSIDDDFFSAGMDSLLALQLRNAIVKNVDLGTDAPLPLNVIFEAGNVRNLAARLRLGDSHHDDSTAHIGKMAAMVEQYSNFTRPHLQDQPPPEKHTIVRTHLPNSPPPPPANH